jgi:Arc/MetJ-type ribon-helix-helix transcriptional regulator
MNDPLNPALEKFIDDQVREGRFASRTEVLEAGVARLMLDPPDELDAEDIAAIEEGLAQLDRGEGRPWGTGRRTAT